MVLKMSNSKEWRPDGWESRVKEQESFADKTRGIAQGFSKEDFEAGADAILNAINSELLPMGIHFEENRIWNASHRTYKKVGENTYLVVDNREAEYAEQ
jgi:hypothetical protein